METPTKLLNLQKDSITIAKENNFYYPLKSFYPIPRNINKSTIVLKKYITKKNSLTTSQVNRDVLADFLHLTMKNGQINNFKEVVKYPLSPIPLSLKFPGSAKRSPVKSSLMKIINYTQVVQDDAYANVGAYIVDLMVLIRAVGMFLIVEELINGVPSIILRDGGRLDLVANSYREISWKNSPQEQLEMRDHSPFLSQQKLRSKTPIPSYMKTKTSDSLSNFSSTGLLTAEGKH